MPTRPFLYPRWVCHNINTMLFLSMVHHYLLWHYSRAFLEIFHVWFNLIWFVVHFFSIPQLLRSWFSPWKRIVEDKGKKWDFEDFFAKLVIGLMSRIVGIIMRTIVLFIGLVATLTIIFLGLATYAFWVAAPLVIISLFGFGLTLLVV